MKLSTVLVLVPVAVIAAFLGIANREEVAFKLDPFTTGDAGIVFVMPLFLLVFLSFLMGVVVGGTTIAVRGARNARRKRTATAAIADRPALDGHSQMAPPPS